MDTRYTLIVGTKDWSSWSLRPWLAMRHSSIAFEEELVHLRRGTTPEILKFSPSGRVPALVIEEDGRRALIWDSLAICETIAERHPQARLWPDDALIRAEARSYCAEMHSGFADLREQLSMDFARKLPTPPLREATKAQIARIQQAWAAALTRHGGPFLFGRFSIADCMYAPVVSRFGTYGIALDAELAGYAERMMALPAMQEWGKAAKAEVDAGLA
ncbi:MAG: glutathione S-transferase family protein [Alphaproteobacteria bacterium]|nr:glutathione S-transferase family protein [Alphaproteobacteria bacterium]MBV9692150.1 glutathione S-transferase family protein [Alphaproteobacteria bacterium]